MIEGAFAPDRLLQVFRDFVFYPDDSKKSEAIICRYPQFFAANKMLESLSQHKRPAGDGKGGIYFGATGCGKTYTMLFLSRQLMLRKKDVFHNPTIVLITDREDLDTQTSKLFVTAKEYLHDKNIKSIESRDDLHDTLSNCESGGVYITTIQKFCESTGLLSDRSNIICISDEAHRSNAGVNAKLKKTDKGVFTTYGFAYYLRESLPNAVYCGFTGTPVDEAIAVFGDVVDAYTMKESCDDGITVRIAYEPRLAPVMLSDIGFGYFGVLCTKKFNPNEQQKKNMNLSLCKYIFLFWLYDLLFMAIFNRWCALIYAFGLLSIVIIFTNLIGVFLSENKLLNKMISFDLILGIGLSVYLIYILPNEQLKTIVTAVVAALYGGILTLVGVAWTIRHSDKERREEEKKKAKPIFTFNMVLEEIKDIRTKKVCFDVADNGIEYECHVVAELENSDHALFEVKRVFHDGKWNEIEGNTVVLPNKSVYFDFRFNYDVNNLFLEVKDGLDNSYYYEIKVLSCNLLPGIVRNSNTELLHTIREVKEISIDEINKSTTKR